MVNNFKESQYRYKPKTYNDTNRWKQLFHLEIIKIYSF